MSQQQKVNFHIKTGSRGGKALKGLEVIHDKQIQLPIGLSWLEALQKAFGSLPKLDPAKYHIKRDGERKYALTETIRQYLAEFKVGLKTMYVIRILEGSPTPSGSSGRGRGKPKQEVATISRRIAAPAFNGVSPLGQPQVGSSSGPGQAQGEIGRKKGRKQLKVKVPAPAKKLKAEGQMQIPTMPAPLRSDASSGRDTIPVPTGGGRHRENADPSPARSATANNARGGKSTPVSQSRKRPAIGTPISASGGAPPSQRPRFLEEQLMSSGGGGANRPQMNATPNSNVNGAGFGGRADFDFDDDVDDARSQVTTCSQTSQDMLAEMGIPQEDFKPKFVRAAMNCFSNEQLLILRHQLRQMKADQRKWSKWMFVFPSQSPSMVVLLEQLLGV